MVNAKITICPRKYDKKFFGTSRYKRNKRRPDLVILNKKRQKELGVSG